MDESTLLRPFFIYPMAKYGVRELSRLTKVDTKTIMKYLQYFTQRNIVVRIQEKGKFVYYEANRMSYACHHEKSEAVVKKIIESGLLEYLENEVKPKTIILFGSVAKGTYHLGSDIDLFVQANYKQIDLSKFNKKIGFPVQLFFEPKLQNLTKGLLENIYNGMVLVGSIEVV